MTTNFNELQQKLKELKMNMTTELDNLSIEDLEIVYRYFNLQMRYNTVKEYGKILGANDGMSMITEIFLNAKGIKKDPITEQIKQIVSDEWMAEIKKEMDELYPKLIVIYGKLYAGANLQFVIDSIALINKYTTGEIKE